MSILNCNFIFRPPHKLTSIISSLLRERQAGQVNANPSLTTAAALWARHSQHLKNAATSNASIEDNETATETENNSREASVSEHQIEGKTIFEDLSSTKHVVGRDRKGVRACLLIYDSQLQFIGEHTINERKTLIDGVF